VGDVGFGRVGVMEAVGVGTGVGVGGVGVRSVGVVRVGVTEVAVVSK